MAIISLVLIVLCHFAIEFVFSFLKLAAAEVISQYSTVLFTAPVIIHLSIQPLSPLWLSFHSHDVQTNFRERPSGPRGSLFGNCSIVSTVNCIVRSS